MTLIIWSTFYASIFEEFDGKYSFSVFQKPGFIKTYDNWQQKVYRDHSGGEG